MNVHRSAPISISQDAPDNSSLDRVDGSSQGSAMDTYMRTKPLISNRTRLNSISPHLASPTPPSFVPDGTHQASRVGNYLLVEHVEGHNSGNVFRAVDYNTEEEYICKVYRKDEYRKWVNAYSRTAGHPNINTIVDLIISTNNAYCFLNPGIAMEDSPSDSSNKNPGFRAENLHSLVRSRKRLPESVAAPLFAQVVAAVSHCHQQNIILRDLKLRKFIFSDRERTKLLLETLDDATILDDDDDTMFDRHGCPAYASPEILSCSAKQKNTPNSKGYSGKASDVWSLGVMLYTLLVGRYPFHEPDPISMFTKISRGQFNLPESLSSEARDLVRNLLRRQPSERLQSNCILDHPWLRKSGNCWDSPRPGISLGAGGDKREVDKVYFHQFSRYSWGQSLPTSLYSRPHYEDQSVPEVSSMGTDDDTAGEMLFEFGE